MQKHEGDKLLHVAAHHLDVIRAHYPQFAVHMGGTSQKAENCSNSELSYNEKKKRECEENIREEMDNIMTEKYELMAI